MDARLLEPRNAVALALVLVLAAGMLASGFGRASEREAAGPRAVALSGRVLGDLLGGVRTAAAAYLWIKLDNEHHEYYGGDLTREDSLIPLYRLATWLDPRMQKAYYVASFMLWQQRRRRESLEFAREGLANNPTSALLVFNLGQLYLLNDGEAAQHNALRYLSRAERMTRRGEKELRLEVLGALVAAYRKAGLAEPASLAKELDSLGPRENHEDDHDDD